MTGTILVTLNQDVEKDDTALHFDCRLVKVAGKLDLSFSQLVDSRTSANVDLVLPLILARQEVLQLHLSPALLWHQHS